MEVDRSVKLGFTGANAHEYLTVGTHLTVVPTADYPQGRASRGDKIYLVDMETGQQGVGRVLGYVTGVTVDKFQAYADLIKLGASDLRTPKKLIESLYDKYPDLPMDEWTFIAFRTYMAEVI